MSGERARGGNVWVSGCLVSEHHCGCIAGFNPVGGVHLAAINMHVGALLAPVLSTRVSHVHRLLSTSLIP